MSRVLTGTYRLQLRPGFGFDEAAAVVPYLADLGVSHLYLSPVLQAAPGSTHGYDVIDHGHLSADLGGREAFDRLSAAAGGHGLGLVVDVVPNHMCVPTPASLNAPLWSVLRDGPGSPYARWFDVDWSTQDRALLMPVLGRRIGQCLADGEIALDTSGPEPVLRYFDHVFPVRPGTEHLPLDRLVDRQWYRLAYWRVADEELNYRRFFDVDTLAALRVEDPAVFDATHDLLVGLHRDGAVDGFRIDHPDGLADPRGYLHSLAEATGGAWVVVEKILEGDERLPEDWACAGTTGYDTLNRVLGLLLDPSGAEPLSQLWGELTGAERDFHAVVDAAKRGVVAAMLRAEVNRLVELAAGISHDDVMLRDFTRRGLEEALVELLVEMPVYRAYVIPGEAAPEPSVRLVEGAAERATAARPELADDLALLRDLALGRLGTETRRAEFCVRFQQTCGPVMAKGVEDTAFYRWFRLAALNEVGGEPARFAVSPDLLHGWAVQQQARHPEGMTSLSTHDTKRAEDVRARLTVLAELPEEWRATVTRWRAAASAHRTADGLPDDVTDYLLWQTLVGTWPITADRLTAYLEKATREAKVRTTWTAPDEAYDAAVRGYAEAALADATITAAVAEFVERIEPYSRVASLTQKLVQLTLPGVPDVYQGCDLVDRSLVDPDNRRDVDYAERAGRLARLDAGEAPRDDHDEKLLVVSRVLRLRREQPGWFGLDGGYEPLATTSQHAVGFVRGGAVASLATRLPVGLERAGGWGESFVVLPAGRWRDLLTGKEFAGGELRLVEALDTLPVALLVRS
ncbi:MAG TPA: malto-oligosyltrehalose synthase [Jiangellales bacterium]|nr:malto-oligosyltrehalose synthase [Jiangellales bacterium]